MLTRQFSYIKGQEFSIFYFFSEIVTWHEGIGKFRFKSSFKGHTVDFKMCYVIIILYRLSVMLYGEGNICHSITLVCLQTNRKQPGGKHVRIVKKRLRIFNKIAFGGQLWANIFRMEKQNIKISHEEGDIRVYGIAVLGFFSCGISVILILTCGMRFFIIFADGIRWNKIFHSITLPFIFAFLSIQCAKQTSMESGA